jgi:hypothetical protein
MVNRPFGDKSQQLHNRHARSDFETKTQVRFRAFLNQDLSINNRDIPDENGCL